jgi:molybdopterin/thiamine biosynthesis adenylyltransferase
VIPQLKNCVWQRAGDDLWVVSEPETQIVLSDPGGQAEHLLGLLRDGTRDEAQLAAALAEHGVPATHGEVTAAIAALDELRLLVDAVAPMALPDHQAERYFSNLAFFSTFASLERSPASFQGALLDAHVVFLGTGGLGSTAIQALTGAGVGQMTLLDNDVVELRNFARQYLYRTQDIGLPKVERAADWVRAFSPATDIRAVSRRIGGPADVADLLPGADLVVSGVDQPDGVDEWVNEACVAAGVPYVRGGMFAQRLAYWSVAPGRSACLACHQHELAATAPEQGVAPERLATGLDRVNRGTGPGGQYGRLPRRHGGAALPDRLRAADRRGLPAVRRLRNGRPGDARLDAVAGLPGLRDGTSTARPCRSRHGRLPWLTPRPARVARRLRSRGRPPLDRG